MDSRRLQELYEQVYAEGKEQFFSFSTADVSQEVISEIDWLDCDALEIGCGTGETAYLIASAGAQVLAMDYAESAIAEARRRHSHPNLIFKVGGLEDIEGTYDVVVMQEVIEHLDDPESSLANLKGHLRTNGHLIVTCPSFINLRGYVWMTLQLLFNVPMSLTDKHFICPFDMERWAKKLGFSCHWRTFRHGQAHGEQMLVDMRRRLTNALQDAGLTNSRVDLLLQWLDQARRFELDSEHNGAKALYHLRSHRPS
jgi:2-polyprenyl-3-methyl-5-hydroxy-6-metoxy-1,4-benzoquinol methylase